MVLTCASGLEFLLDLAKPPALRAGDGLRFEDGRIVAVEAAPERLLEITCADARTLARIAWHLGNRHLTAEIGAHVIHIREDHVIADMVRGLGAEARPVERVFNPEGGAYAAGVAGHHHHHHPSPSPSRPWRRHALTRSDSSGNGCRAGALARCDHGRGSTRQPRRVRAPRMAARALSPRAACCG
jgi:urease accessory protein